MGLSPTLRWRAGARCPGTFAALRREYIPETLTILTVRPCLDVMRKPNPPRCPSHQGHGQTVNRPHRVIRPQAPCRRTGREVTHQCHGRQCDVAIATTAFTALHRSASTRTPAMIKLLYFASCLPRKGGPSRRGRFPTVTRASLPHPPGDRRCEMQSMLPSLWAGRAKPYNWIHAVLRS